MFGAKELEEIKTRLCLHNGPPHSKNLGLDYEAQPGDIITTSYPRSGRTWMTHILWSLHNDGEAYPEGRKLYKEYKWLEMEGKESVESDPAPRILTSHLPMDLIPKNNLAKYICIVRNPKDVAVSYFWHNLGFGVADREWKKTKDFDEYFREFLDGTLIHGSYFDHLKSYVPFLANENCKLVFYEDLIVDGPKTVGELAKFLGIPGAEDVEFVQKVLKNTRIEEMRKSQDRWFPAFAWKADHGFIRKGDTGSWRETLSRAQSDKIDQLFSQEMNGTEAETWWKDIMKY